MSFVSPLALVLLLPAAGLVAWFLLGGGQAAIRLPGHWHRVIDTAMRPFMARRVLSRNRLPIVFWLTLWTLLVLALARPELDFGAPAAYGNLGGRVIVIDLGAGMDVERQRLLAYRLIDASPQTPTALVAATAEAFDVVPLTTDRAQLDRYLQVIELEVMPVSGWAPGIAIVHAESVLERAGVIVGQMILLTGARVPKADPATAGDWLRALVVDNPHAPGWEDFAERIDARLVDEASIQDVIDDLDDAVSDAIRDSDKSGNFALTPWLIAGAALMWVLFFRRFRSS